MIRSRKQMEAHEQAMLAPFAQKSAGAARKHLEPSHPYRTEYQRDRARIIHSRAFRRLEYKTQVFLNGTGDHLRTRLTHTMEVASISRTIARALGLNEDLAEAIALAHDLGHSPFGHAGEKTLGELMQEDGGFDHNEQSVRVVELLETRYPKFAGLNLTAEVLEGLRKHQKFYDPPEKGGQKAFTSPSLEAQIANLADEITYYSHDIDDGIEFDLITTEQLDELEIWRAASEEVRADFPELNGKRFASYAIRCLINREVDDVVKTSSELIEASEIKTANDARRQKKPLIRYSQTLLHSNAKMRKFLYKNLYHHPSVAGANQRGCRMLRNVFEAYIKNPRLLGEASARRVRKEGLSRTVCDYVSGMTDRYLMDEHARLSGETNIQKAQLSRLHE